MTTGVTLLHLPSRNGEAYDRFFLVSPAVTRRRARAVANAAIRLFNREDAKRHGTCSDGGSVAENLGRPPTKARGAARRIRGVLPRTSLGGVASARVNAVGLCTLTRRFAGRSSWMSEKGPPASARRRAPARFDSTRSVAHGPHVRGDGSGLRGTVLSLLSRR